MNSILGPLLAILVVLLPTWLVYGYLELQARMGGGGKAVRRRKRNVSSRENIQ